MKYYQVFFAAMALMAASCSNESEEQETKQDLVPVMVRVNDFTVSQGEYLATRATAVSDYANLKALTLAFYKSDGTEQYKHVQYKADASTYTSYGEFSTSLPMGTYTMVVLGSTAESAAAGNIVLTGLHAASYADVVRETFVAKEEVTVSSNTPLNLSATLDRSIAKVTVVSTDGRAANVHSIRTTFAGGGKSVDPTTGLNTTNAGYSNTVVTTRPVGNTTTVYNALFLATDEQTMNITIETLDEDGNVLFSKTVPNVPLKRNRETTLTGAMYSASASAGSFQLNADWLTGNGVSF